MAEIDGILYPENGEGPHIVSGPVIAKQVSDKKFEELITEIRSANRSERIRIAQSQIADITNYFATIWDESPEDFVRALLTFLSQATQIGCAGIKSVSEKKRAEIIEFMQEIPDFQKQFVKYKEFFDYTRLTDEEYQFFVSVFLCASLEPLISPYPNTLFAYMLCVACAETVNEHGIQAIRKLRDDYIPFALRKQKGSDEDFAGHFQPTSVKKATPALKTTVADAKGEKDTDRKQQAEIKDLEKAKHDEQMSSIKQLRQQYSDFVQHGEKLKQDYNASLDNAMLEIREKMHTCINCSIKNLESELTLQQKALASLGLFSFSKKKECKETIAELERKLNKIKAADYFAQQIAPYQTKMEATKKNYANTIEQHIRNAFADKEYPNYEYLEKVRNLCPIEEQHWSKLEHKTVAEDILCSLEISSNGMTYVELLNEQVDHAASLNSVLRKLSSAGYISSMYIGGEERYFHYSDKRFSKTSIPTLIPQYRDTPWPIPIDAKTVLQWKEE